MNGLNRRCSPRVFTQAIGSQRLRDYSLAQQQRLVALLAGRGVGAAGGTLDHGAFVVVDCVGTHPARAARQAVETLSTHGIIADARGGRIRLCPDVLTTADELDRAASGLGDALAKSS